MIVLGGLSPEGGHPTSARAAIRRWVSEIQGEVTLTGTRGNDDAYGDGVIGRIFVNGDEVFQQAVNGQSTEHSVVTNVAVGGVIDFVIDTGESNDATGDAANFTARDIFMFM